MQNNIVSLVCFALLATWARFAGARAASRVYLTAAGLLTAAAIGGVFAAVSEQFSGWDWLAALIAIAVGFALAAAIYFLLRSIEERSLLVSPAMVSVAAVLPIAVGVFCINGAGSVSLFGAAGLGLAAVAFALAIFGKRAIDSEVAKANRVASTLLFLALVGFVLLGIVFYDAVELSRAQDGPFLMVVFAAAGVTLQAIGSLRREKFAYADVAYGVVLGAPLGAGFLFLLLTFAARPSWLAIGFAAVGEALLAALLFVIFFRERWRVAGYIGLACLAGATALLFLA
jgi:hypothetical protein